MRLREGRYLLPEDPGFSVEIRPESRAAYHYPDGAIWAARSPGAL